MLFFIAKEMIHQRPLFTVIINELPLSYFDRIQKLRYLYIYLFSSIYTIVPLLCCYASSSSSCIGSTYST